MGPSLMRFRLALYGHRLVEGDIYLYTLFNSYLYINVHLIVVNLRYRYYL